MKIKTKAVKTLALANKRCLPCASGAERLNASEIKKLLNQLSIKWTLKRRQQLERSFKFPDFATALKFTNQVGAIAEKQGHHPDVFLAYGQVRLQLSTHEAKGLTENDFILAAKVDKLA